MHIKDKVSIITPLYNGDKYILELVNSVLRQTYSNWELIIVDDCSTDMGVDVLSKYLKQDKRIRLIQNDFNSGPALSRNKAIFEAQGEFIAFLDSDDLWDANKLSVQISYMKRNNIFFSYTYYNQINEQGKIIRKIEELPSKVNYLSTIKSNKIGCLTAVYSVKHFGKVYMENIKKRQDFTLWLKLLKKVDYAYCVPYNLASYRIREGSISSNKLKLVKYHWYIYRRIEKHHFFKSLYFISNYIVSKLLNR